MTRTRRALRLCRVCGAPLWPTLAGLGERTHPVCDPNERTAHS